MTPRTLALPLLAAAAILACPFSAKAMQSSTTQSAYGKLPDGTAIEQYTLTNENGLVLKVITYGAIITELRVPDRTGALGDVVLGFDRLEPYETKSPYFGAAIGRVGNRIARGRFTLDGKTYTLAINNAPNHLHGGLKGFDKVVWKAAASKDAKGAPGVSFEYTSADGEEGYPGTLHVTMTYVLNNANELVIRYRATTDKDTPVNLTNHTYFNLSGRGSILDHVLRIAASRFTPVDDTLIPTGAIAPVAGTPMDFTAGKPIGRDLGLLANRPQGYDHNFVLDSGGGHLALAASVYDPASGRALDTLTDQPGVQFYSGNFLDATVTGKNGAIYHQHEAFCLETQHFPDSVNHPNFPSTILHPGQVYHSTTIYRFSVR